MVAAWHRAAPPRGVQDDSSPMYFRTFQGKSNITAISIYGARTFVVEDPHATTWSVRATADDDDANLDGLVVSESVGSDGETTLSITGSRGADYTVDVLVPTQSIRTVASMSADDVVVLPRTLVNSTAQAISISASTSGDVFVQDVAIVASRLSLHTLGSGSIQWEVPITIAADAIDFRVSSSGDVLVFADTTLFANTLIANTLGSGGVYVASNNMSVPTRLQTQVTGSGDVSYAARGTCGRHELDLLGSGDANTATVRCAVSTVMAAGSGDIYVSASDALDVTRLGSADIYVLRPAPPHVTGQFQLVSDVKPDAPDYMHVPMHEGVTARVSTGDAPPSSSSPSLRHHSKQTAWPDALVAILIVFALFRCIGWLCCRHRRAKQSKQALMQVPTNTSMYYTPQQQQPPPPMYYQQDQQPYQQPNTQPYQPSNYQAPPPHVAGNTYNTSSAYYYATQQQQPQQQLLPPYNTATYSGTTSYVDAPQGGGGGFGYTNPRGATTADAGNFYQPQPTYGASNYGPSAPAYDPRPLDETRRG
ncbi:Aste57867_2954 [Aphanomyces stellatus]|uniref:Aste57867_2954 protein n=1 Tax=Aphanomyces stellatus TaxID=120398 RepID=A0A485K8R1_9STRA|nr:hypothetical protein As57867_002945 [Aphanomyces stellatus]VFT80137.1 Aste57867_2954 [Aphanomyces stellatus]